MTAVGGERDRINTIFMTLFSFSPLHEITGADVPDAHAFIQTARCDVSRVGRNGHGRDSVLDLESENACVVLDIPETNRAITRARSNISTVRCKVERINVLLMTGEGVTDCPCLNIPDLYINISSSFLGSTTGITYANDLVFRPRSQIPAIRTEAYTADVEISFCGWHTFSKVADLFTGANIEDLCRSVTSRGYIATVLAEAHTTDHALMRQIVYEIHVKSTLDAWVKDGVPIFALTLQMRRKFLRVEFGQLIADLI